MAKSGEMSAIAMAGEKPEAGAELLRWLRAQPLSPESEARLVWEDSKDAGDCKHSEVNVPRRAA